MNLEEAILRARAAGAEVKSHYGIDAQTDKTIEECGELIVALCHYRLGRLHGDTSGRR